MYFVAEAVKPKVEVMENFSWAQAQIIKMKNHPHQIGVVLKETVRTIN